MKWSDFLQKVYQGLFQIFTFIPPSTFNLDFGVEYYVLMIGLWIIVFFTIWLVLFIFYKVCSIVGG